MVHSKASRVRSSCSRYRRSYPLRLPLGAVSSMCVIRTLVILRWSAPEYRQGMPLG